MPTPRINSLKKANQVFVAESKTIKASPSPARKNAVIARLVNDLEHMPQSIEKKKSILIRVGKYLKRPAYRASLIAAMVAGGLVTYHGGKNIPELLSIRRKPLTKMGAYLYNVFEPSRSGLSRRTELDLSILARAIATLFGITWTGVMARELAVDLIK